MEIVIKKGANLNKVELNEIKDAVFREFQIEFKRDDRTSDKLFFLLKEDKLLLAMGVLWKVRPVFFGEKEYVFYGVLNVIAHQKGEGHGKKLMTTIRKYLIEKNLTGFGFCMPKNQGFYKKCGFNVTTNSTQRFIYKKNGEQITNQDGQVIFYIDSSDRFMEKVLANPNEKVFIPTDGLW